MVKSNTQQVRYIACMADQWLVAMGHTTQLMVIWLPCKHASAVYIMFIVIKIKKNIQNFKGFLIKRMRKDKKKHYVKCD